MSQIGEFMALCLQERDGGDRGGGGAARTILELLTETRMDGVDRLRRRKSLQERLGLKGMVCCGTTWGFGPSTMSSRGHDEEYDDDDPLHQQIDVIDVTQTPPETNSDRDCIEASPRMNLAAALAAERHYRSAATVAEDGGGDTPNNELDYSNNNNRITNSTPPRGLTVEPGTPLRVSLMRLLEETDDVTEKEKDGVVGIDSMCCVCMGRKKGAAFIPCGHTFCRICSRELWLNRGACPLCNRTILEILDIY